MANNAQVNDQYQVRGQTIAIKHYLNKRVKPRKVVHNGKDFAGYPIYIRITVKQQDTQLKSIIDQYVIPELFYQFLRENSEVIKNEVKIIRDQILAFSPFENLHFSLKHSLNDFDVMEKDIRYIFLKSLIKEFEQAYTEDYIYRASKGYPNSLVLPDFKNTVNPTPDQLKQIWEEQASLLLYIEHNIKHGITHFAMHTSFCADDNHPNLLDLWKRYETDFWRLEVYCSKIEVETGHSLITLSDWINGRFDTLFIQSGFNIDALTSLKKSVDKLRAKHEDLDIIMRNSLP